MNERFAALRQQRQRRKAPLKSLPALAPMRSPKSATPSLLTAPYFAIALRQSKPLRLPAWAYAPLAALSMLSGCANTTALRAMSLPPLSQAAQAPCNPPPKLQGQPTKEDALALIGGLALDNRECELRRAEAANQYEAARAALKGDTK